MGCGVERAGEGFEKGFNFVMVIAPREDYRVEVKPSVRGKRLEQMADQIGRELPHAGGGECRVKHRVCPPAQIDHHPRKRFIHRHITVRGADDPPPVTKRLIERFPQANKRIFSRVMLINVQIAICGNSKVKQAVRGEKGKHMIEKTDPCMNIGLACAIEGKGERNVGFVCMTGEGGRAHGERDK